MAMPQIPRVDREQAINDMVEALALQEAALASLIYAEAGKIDGLVAAGIPAPQSIQEVENYQASVAAVLQFAADKAQSMHTKLELLRTMMEQKREQPDG